MKDKKNKYDDLRKNAEQIINSPVAVENKLQQLCELLERNIDYFDWVGFYLVDKTADKGFVSYGDTITFTITVKNDGEKEDIVDVTVKDIMNT